MVANKSVVEDCVACQTISNICEEYSEFSCVWFYNYYRIETVVVEATLQRATFIITSNSQIKYA